MRRPGFVACLALFTLLASSAGATGLIANGRAFHLRVPSGGGSAARPLLILLHGAAAATSAIEDAYIGFGDIADAENFLYAYPDGSRLPLLGAPIWNGYGCCQFGVGASIDDVGYIDAIIDAVIAAGNPVSQVFLVGHSNGGILTHRYACERRRTVAPVTGIVSLGGPTWVGSFQCPNTGGPVSVLGINGTADTVAQFAGGFLPPLLGSPAVVYSPSADQSVHEWADRNGCGTATVDSVAIFDIDQAVGGPETTRRTFPGCSSGRGAVELWIMVGSQHIPKIARPPDPNSFALRVFRWLTTH